MTRERKAFLEVGDSAAELLGRAEVAACWEQPSVLAEFTVGGLAGHLFRCIEMVERYVSDDRRPVTEPITAATYYLERALPPDPDDPANKMIRANGLESASPGPSVLASEARGALTRLAQHFEREPEDRKLQVIGDLVLTLDQYLRTRIIELVVHSDDLARSVGLAGLVELPGEAQAITIETLVELARLRHGDLAVIWALARRERDEMGALRVI